MSEFTSQGGEREYPNIYVDRQRMHQVAELADDRLIEQIQQYIEFVNDEEVFEPHRERGEDILAHLMFERLYREGYFNE